MEAVTADVARLVERLRYAGTNEAIPLAAGIFLGVLNIFPLFLRLFSRSS
jgi:hypothetical protein